MSTERPQDGALDASGESQAFQPIPFNRPSFVGDEVGLVHEALASGALAGLGPLTSECEEILRSCLPGSDVLLTTSCTSALEASALLLSLAPGDEVIVPTYTFVSTAAAFSAFGARPVFADIRPDTLNIDEAQVDALVSERTRAIVVTHYGGVGAEMDRLVPWANSRGVVLIEDNAHGLFGRYRDHPLGTFGTLAALSFHATKNLSSGQGGALVVSDPNLVERAHAARNNGTDRRAFERGDVDRYSWVTQGTNAVASEFTAALVVAQLRARSLIAQRRQEIWTRYERELAGWMAANGVATQVVPDYCTPSFHLFPLIFEDGPTRTRFISHLASRKILSVFHYSPLHSSPMGQRFVSGDQQFPVAEWCAERLARLPLFFALTDEEQSRVIDAVVSFSDFA
jgi:dTDP-4-amino-4,6-dideoxygalactose transaminase